MVTYMQTGLNNITQILSIIQKVIMTFNDASEKPEERCGSGFWISTDKNPLLFVTNKHNIEPKIKDSNYDLWSLKKLQIKCRAFDEKSQRPDEQTSIIDCTSWKRIYESDNNAPDVAILIPIFPIKATTITNGKITPLTSSSLADKHWFNSLGKIADHAYFIGFPDIIWKNAKYEYPISRNCHISSDPYIDFTEETYNNNVSGIKTKQTCLVAGLSFGGSSGSPIFTYEVGFNDPTGTLNYSGRYLEPKLIGIMSGHWFDKSSSTPHHKGISYFTKSSAILDLIKKHDL